MDNKILYKDEPICNDIDTFSQGWEDLKSYGDDMQKKLLFLDVETTGLSGDINGIHQLSGIIEIDGEVKEEFNFFIKPFDEDFIDKQALDATNVSREQIQSYPEPIEIHKKLLEIFGKYVNKFKRYDKFHLIAYNSSFDEDHVRAFFKKCEDKFYGSWVFTPSICVMRLAGLFLMKDRPKMVNFKQQTVAEHLKIVKEDNKDAVWHDAMWDVKIARDIYNHIMERLQWVNL